VPARPSRKVGWKQCRRLEIDKGELVGSWLLNLIYRNNILHVATLLECRHDGMLTAMAPKKCRSM
jgi:hypothetical protein